MRVSAKVDYALRAVAHIAADSDRGPVKAEAIARVHQIPPRFLLSILTELKHARLLRSQRGSEGGYTLSRPATEITLADIMRAVDGPLANVHETRLGELGYAHSVEALEEVWRAVRSSLRSVLEGVTVADVVAGTLPAKVVRLAEQYRAQEAAASLADGRRGGDRRQAV